MASDLQQVLELIRSQGEAFERGQGRVTDKLEEVSKELNAGRVRFEKMDGEGRALAERVTRAELRLGDHTTALDELDVRLDDHSGKYRKLHEKRETDEQMRIQVGKQQAQRRSGLIYPAILLGVSMLGALFTKALDAIMVWLTNS